MLHVVKLLANWEESVICTAAIQIYLDKEEFLLTLLIQAVLD